MRINTHAHVILPDVLGKAGKYGPEIVIDSNGAAIMRVGAYSSRVGSGKGLTEEDFARISDVQRRLDEMDAEGVDAMVVTISPLFYLYWAEDDIRTSFASAQNDALAKYCAQAPDRLFYLATLPLPNVEASIEEVRRVGRMGARGVNIGTGDFDGVDLDSEQLWPLFAELEAAALPVFIHPYPLTMASGEIDRYNLSWVVGYNYQETVAFAHLALGGVFEMFPNLKVCITHGGGNVPYQFGRLEKARERQPDVRATRPIREYMGNVYFDILLHDRGARQFLVEFAGASQLMVGDNFGGWDAADGWSMLAELDLSEADRRKIAGENAAALFRIESRS